MPMKIYPCTKNPPCTNVTGHRTPVCPNNTSNASSKKLKTDAVLESIHEPVVVLYHYNGKLYREEWGPGEGGGLESRSYDEYGNFLCEKWEDSKGPEGIKLREYHENGKVSFEGWEPGKGPDGLRIRSYRDNGKIYYERWEPGKGPDGLAYRSYYDNGKVLREEWDENKGPKGIFCRMYDPYGNVIDER